MKIVKLSAAIRPHAPKIVVYGKSGIGKTTLIGSLPGKVLILSAEAGLLALGFAAASGRFEVVEIATVDDLVDAHRFLAKGEHGYDWVALDSASEIAEVILTNAKKRLLDPRQAYGEVIDRMTAAMRAFRDLPIGVVFLAKEAGTKDEATGRVSYGISMPGAKLGDAIPYLFDEVFRMISMSEDVDGKRVDVRYLQTCADARTSAKDRSGALAPLEVADLGHVAAKIVDATRSLASRTEESADV